jgi:hypothetical protein
VVSGGETLEFPISRRLTTADRLTPTAAPAGSLLMQDTAGPAIAMEFDLTDNDLAAAIINHGEIRVTVDTVAFVNNQPANFARPPVSRLELQVLANTGAIFVLETAPVRNGTVTFSSDLLRSAMQGLAEDVGTVDHFRISVDLAENGVGTVVVRGPTVDGSPLAEIIYSKLK